ncbi:nicotinate-nicotinamide nucleotide adenylyltransferase, partial [Campylobacter jejuni]|nr:nicotinate-nicotinamide nucleotide adenylyltransferase [Campylobacter jejuni]
IIAYSFIRETLNTNEDCEEIKDVLKKYNEILQKI